MGGKKEDLRYTIDKETTPYPAFVLFYFILFFNRIFILLSDREVPIGKTSSSRGLAH